MRMEDVTSRKSESTRTKSLAELALYAVLIGGACCSLARPCVGQEEQRVETSPTNTASQSLTTSQAPQSTKPDETESEQKKKSVPRGSFVVAPLPISSPAIGTGLVPVLGYIFPFSRNDKISPPSVIGVAGLVTNNGSRGFAVGGQLYLKKTRIGSRLALPAVMSIMTFMAPEFLRAVSHP
jgi:hypothetical protein